MGTTQSSRETPESLREAEHTHTETPVGAPRHGVGSCKAVVTIHPEARITAAVREMCARGIGCLVVDDEGRMVGILTERDILNRVLGVGADPSAKLVREVMTEKVISIPPGTSLDEAQKTMTVHSVRHLPILANGVAVGITSSRDVVAQQLEKNKAMKAAAEQVAMLSTLLKSLDFGEVVDMVAGEVPKLFGAGRSVLYLPDANGLSEIGPLITRDRCPCPDRDIRLRGETDEAILDKPVTYGETPEVCRKLGCRSANVLLPLEMEGLSDDGSASRKKSLGYLCMCDFDRSVDMPEELAWYKGVLVRGILNSNLRNARLYQDAKQDSLTDPLTGVGSRRLFDKELEAEFIRATRHEHPFCVAMLDVDNFRGINDRLGHQVGDMALTELAACLSRTKRTGDVLARYGGDEFVLLLPETDRDGAIVLIERIRKEVKRLDMPDGLSVSFSCGLVQQPATSGVSPNELIRRADIALYEAKKAGRDRTETWSRIADGGIQETHLESRRVKELEARILGLSVQSKEMFVQSIWGLVQALEARDPYTKSHSENVMRYSVGIAETMGIPGEDADVIRRAAMIHDVGKIGVPDSILRKRGKLTRSERRTMEQHPLIAVQILDQMRFLEREMPIVRHHHEHWDGRGYPDGLSGAAIPLGARVLAVADAFDAITSDRVYRNARGLSEAVRALVEGLAKQFDADVVAAAQAWIEKIGNDLGKFGELTARDLLETQEACILAV